MNPLCRSSQPAARLRCGCQIYNQREARGAQEASLIEFLESASDVLAVRITGKLAEDELQTITDRLERSLAAQEETHIFVEPVDCDGFAWSALGAYLPRAAKMLGQLERFGRVAIGPDIGWLRAAARVERALLPGLRYELFTPDERTQALAWIEGRSERPHRAALTLLTTDNPTSSASRWTAASARRSCTAWSRTSASCSTTARARSVCSDGSHGSASRRWAASTQNS